MLHNYKPFAAPDNYSRILPRSYRVFSDVSRPEEAILRDSLRHERSAIQNPVCKGNVSGRLIQIYFILQIFVFIKIIDFVRECIPHTNLNMDIIRRHDLRKYDITLECDFSSDFKEKETRV